MLPTTQNVAALEHYIKAGHAENRPLTSFAKWGKQDVYRHMEPIRLIPPCLGCHGKPKGEPDMLGFAEGRAGEPATSSA